MGPLVLGFQSRSWSLGASPSQAEPSMALAGTWSPSPSPSGGREDRGAVLPTRNRRQQCRVPQMQTSRSPHLQKPAPNLYRSWPERCRRAPPHTPEAYIQEWGGAVHRRGKPKAPKFRPLQGRESLHWWVPGFQDPLLPPGLHSTEKQW